MIKLSRFLLLWVTLLALSLPVYGQNSAEGEWTGAISLPGTTLEVSVMLEMDGEAWTGNIDIPLQNARDLPLSDISVSETTVVFTIQDVPGNPTFNGTISDDQMVMSGSFSQAGQSFPFELKRVSTEDKAEATAILNARLDSLRQFIPTLLDSMKVPGTAVAIVHGGEVVFSEGFGKKDVEANLPVTPETIFAIGSSSKAFTATTLAFLVDEGLVEWDKPVRNYLPDFRMYDEYATEHLTVRDLLTHKSGLPRHDLLWYGSDLTRDEMFARLRYLKPSKELRETWQYQNLMFLTAGYLAGKLTDSSWEDQVQKRIFTPLGMTSSNFSVLDSQASDNFAQPYKRADEDSENRFERMPFRDISQIGPAGSINSNVVDMAKWVQFQLNKGKVGDNELLPATTLTELHTPQFVANGRGSKEIPFTLYGMGWFVQDYRGHLMVQHGGNIDGFSALVSFFPNDDLGLVVLTNMNGTGFPSIVQNKTADLFFELPVIDWIGRVSPKPSEDKEDEEPEEKAEEDSGRVPDTAPSHDLKAYTGMFEHPGYGEISVTMEGDSLKATYNSFSSTLRHWHYDVFEFTLAGGMGKLKTRFETDVDGDIRKLFIPLEPSVEAIEFERKAEERFTTQAYLEQFAGEFEIENEQRVTISVEGGQLTASLPGQPTYILVPTLENTFDLKGLAGYSVRFKVENGTTRSLTFRQPNGNFTFERVKDSE